jgi:hypothetical protein
MVTKDYKFTLTEYAAVLGISKEAVRSRRRIGKLEGLYIFKDGKYLYALDRPNKTKTTSKKPPKKRRRGVHKSGGKTNYKSSALEKHNAIKMIAAARSKLDDETLALVPRAIEEAKKMRSSEVLAARKPNKDKQFKNYGSGIYNAKTAAPDWKDLNKTKKKKDFNYY